MHVYFSILANKLGNFTNMQIKESKTPCMLIIDLFNNGLFPQKKGKLIN
jgi:hypothetical protein